MAVVRLDKYISQSLGITRQEAKQLIKKGLIKTSERVLLAADEKLDPDNEIIFYNNERLSFDEYVYYMLNKPKNVVSATVDNLHSTVTDLILDDTHKDIFPVGRLDIDTEGLLLITNDGELAHRLTSPAGHVDKVYYVKVTGQLTSQTVTLFKEGLDIGEKKNTKPATLELVEVSEHESIAKVTIFEGKFHQVKRMFGVCGHKVLYLKRLKMGTLELDEKLLPGEYRKLTKEEIRLLKQR